MGININQANIGLVSLTVLEENLILNMENHGYSIVYNRTLSKVVDFVNSINPRTKRLNILVNRFILFVNLLQSRSR